MAHKKAAWSAKNLRTSKPKYRGVKLFGGQTARAGNIVIRQKGDLYQLGKNVYKGSDFTIHAAIDGVVMFRKKNIKRFDGSTYLKTVVDVMPMTDASDVASKSASKTARASTKATKQSVDASTIVTDEAADEEGQTSTSAATKKPAAKKASPKATSTTTKTTSASAKSSAAKPAKSEAKPTAKKPASKSAAKKA